MSKNTPQVITCKAAVAWGLGEPLKIEDIQVEPPREAEVRIKMLCSSLCHTDIHYLKKHSIVPFPQVLGHEGVGIVESIGEGVTELKEGDLVIPTYLGECGKCHNCNSNKTNLCMKYYMRLNGLMVDDTSRMSCKGEKLHHMFSSATWAEYTVVNINYVVKINSSLPLEHASLMSCGFSTGFGAAWKEAKVQKGSTVVVFGLGAVGLGVIEGARTMGASKIIGVDVNELKKEKGEIFGMTDFVNPKKMNKPTAEVIKEMTGGLGADYSFECTGVGPLVNQALDCIAMGTGVTILIGVPPEANTSISIITLILGRTLKGTIFGGIKPQTDLPFILEKAANKEINFHALITHKVKLEDINHAIDELATQPDCLKVIIEMNTQ